MAEKKHVTVRVREATRRDIPALMEWNRAAYPVLAGSHPVFVGKKLLNIAHVCLPDGRIVEQPKLNVTPSLHTSRSSGTVTPRLDRRPDLFQFVSRFRTPEAHPSARGDEGPLGDQVSLRDEHSVGKEHAGRP